jgi:hypothetical protein
MASEGYGGSQVKSAKPSNQIKPARMAPNDPCDQLWSQRGRFYTNSSAMNASPSVLLRLVYEANGVPRNRVQLLDSGAQVRVRQRLGNLSWKFVLEICLGNLSWKFVLGNFQNVAGEGARRVEKRNLTKVIDDDSNAAQIVGLDNTTLQ